MPCAVCGEDDPSVCHLVDCDGCDKSTCAEGACFGGVFGVKFDKLRSDGDLLCITCDPLKAAKIADMLAKRRAKLAKRQAKLAKQAAARACVEATEKAKEKADAGDDSDFEPVYRADPKVVTQ